MNHTDDFISERNWLIGRTAYETGMRAMGIAAMSTDTINALLRGDRLISPSDRVELLAQDRTAKASLREKIYCLEKTGRENLIASITEKGGKTRSVGFPIPLVLDLLQHVWGERAHFLQTLGSSSLKKLSGGVWLSKRGSNPLKVSSIKDVIRDRGFVAAGTKGSIHSLRAAFLTGYACRLLREAKGKFGQSYDARGILLMLAEIAGHEIPDTLKHYLDQAQIREALVGEREFLRGI
jgi:integrase